MSDDHALSFAAGSPSVVSPCPHTPACPPPACLPQSLRAQPARAVSAGQAQPALAVSTRQAPPPDDTGSPNGYDVNEAFIRKFAGTMDSSATGVETVKHWTPRFEGWQLIPMAGVPIAGLLFVNRFNTVSDTWADCAGILSGLLRTDGGKIVKAADNYHAADHHSTPA
ncbi:hypothetical protein [Nonomuraea rhodomycinica]|uniref:Uncharacterized protein n=1 Tax=Nonomuraea rhodomycinica TaxID=1712872 RepID=A0A7Y6MFC7_9ACTN|nr:hypothetical protein [Nonomuraea rhodomycinica]NUW44885.1 hypothetical protein [Nonomuraea rhodomycinica]